MEQITARQETWLKKSTKQAFEVSKNNKKLIPEGKKYPVEDFFPSPKSPGHFKVKLGHGAGDWFIWGEHWDLSWEDHYENDYNPKSKNNELLEEDTVATEIDWNDLNSRVSQYFRVFEVTQGDGRRTPRSRKIKENIIRLAKILDQVREAWAEYLGEGENPAIAVTSWYRPKKVNSEVGGVPNSQHLTGLAADIYPVNGRGQEFEDWLDKGIWSDRALGYGQKSGKNFSHVDLRGYTRWHY